MIYNTIGYRIKALRKEKNIPQQSFNCNILSRTVLSKIENGKIIPSIPQLEHISNILEVPINYFFTTNTELKEVEHKPSLNANAALDKLYNEPYRRT